MTYDQAKTICLENVEPRLGVVYRYSDKEQEDSAVSRRPFYVKSISDGFVWVYFADNGDPAWSERMGAWTRRIRLKYYVRP